MRVELIHFFQRMAGERLAQLPNNARVSQCGIEGMTNGVET